MLDMDRIIKNIEEISKDQELFYRLSKFIDALLKEKVEQDKPFNGLKIGDKVEIKKNSSPIISYDGLPEGFQEDDVGKNGIIISFDIKTMSQKNVQVDLGDKIVWGHHSKLKVVV